MTVRCPKCRKKHEDPAPKRCSCGQSLVTLLAARRSDTDGPGEVSVRSERTESPSTWSGTAPEGDGRAADPTDNNW